jgi:homoserine dehydrogenase
LNLALIGFGNVGRAFARLLEEKRNLHSLRITGIHTVRQGTAIAAGGLPADPVFGPRFPRHEDFLDAARAHVLVELTTLNPTDGEPAITHIRDAFARGMHAVTANKGPVAFAYHQLATVARNRGLRFLHESATMDGTPVYNLVRRCLPAIQVLGFAGALNSTSKVIVEAMERGQSLEDGIEEARRQGITEADPWFDIDGWDSACKAAALANVLMDARTTPQQVDRKGIGKLTPEKVAELKEKGKTVVLISRAKRSRDGVSLRVRAEVLDRQDILATMRGTSNLIQFETDLMGTLGVYSVNPGVRQTAYGVFSDLLEISPDTASPERALSE